MKPHALCCILAGCIAGQFKNLATGTCQPCPKGTYQPNEGSTSCISCPEGSTTVGNDVRNHTSCRSEYPAFLILKVATILGQFLHFGSSYISYPNFCCRIDNMMLANVFATILPLVADTSLPKLLLPFLQKLMK